MNAFKTFAVKCIKRPILNNCKEELSEKLSMRLFIKREPNAMATISYSSKRKLHGDSKNNKEAKEEVKSPDKNLFGMLQASGAVIRLPDSYFYMKVNEHCRNIDCKPPGTHFKSGAIRKKPFGAKLGRLRAFALVVTLIYMGGQLSSLAARMLHEFEIFSLPEDDDD